MSKEYQEGRIAQIEGKRPIHNPYKEDKEKSKSWLKGWLDEDNAKEEGKFRIFDNESETD